jgi:hypothetical protein
MNDKIELPDEVRKYMSELGKRGGTKNKEKGRAYFQGIREGKTWNEIKSDKPESHQ